MINIAIKLATSITYTADGSQTNFSVPFDYLRPAFVHVAINDAEVSEGFTISNRMIMFDSAPAKDSIVHIYRNTPTTRLVSWADASILKAKDMTISEVQQLHILEEASDWSKTNSIVLDEESGVWQGRKFRVSNIADPKDAQDAVTKNYIDNEESSMMQRMNAIKTQTEQLMNTAGNHKDNAYNSAQSASASAASAAESARLAEGYKNVAEAAKSDASLYAANAKTSADNAGASKEAAQSAATTASNFASDARNSAGEAKTYKTNAQTYMNNAELYMNNAKNYSENVNVFIPSVSAAGVLSWTNRAGLDNPASVNIKGAKGDKGDTGAQGIQGVKGDKGDKGDTGAQGLQGVKGDKGDKGDTGAQGLKGDKGDTGATGAPGAAATIRIGNVYTGTPGTNASVSNSGTSTNAVLDFTIPRGNPGADGGVTVDEVLNATSLNPVANKTVYAALQEKVTAEEIANTYAKKSDVVALMSTKLGVTATAYAATRDGAGNNIVDTYAKKTDIPNITVDAELSDTSTNPIQNKVVKTNMDSLYNNLMAKLNVYRSELPTKVSDLENDAGYLTQHQSLDGYAKTSVANIWTARQNFHDLMLYREKYTTYVVNGTSDTPITSTMLYTATGAFTLSLATLAGALSAGQSSVFTAYFAANADYTLTITNAGTIKYIGSASDVAITSAGLLLNILMVKDDSGNLTSIVQASKLS